MSNEVIEWTIGVGVVVLASGLLWLRDTSRDRRGVSEQDKARSERKNAIGARLFLVGVALVLVTHRIYVTHSESERLICVLIDVVAAALAWRLLRAYDRSRITEREAGS